MRKEDARPELTVEKLERMLNVLNRHVRYYKSLDKTLRTTTNATGLASRATGRARDVVVGQALLVRGNMLKFHPTKRRDIGLTAGARTLDISPRNGGGFLFWRSLNTLTKKINAAEAYLRKHARRRGANLRDNRRKTVCH